MPLCIASENRRRRGTEIFFRDERHVLQAPLHNSGKIKGSERWLNTKPANGELGFASNTPFAGLTSSSGALTFSIELLWSRLPHIPFISFQVFLGLISIRFLLHRIRQSLRQIGMQKNPVEGESNREELIYRSGRKRLPVIEISGSACLLYIFRMLPCQALACKQVLHRLDMGASWK